jgi:hypothetical protein
MNPALSNDPRPLEEMHALVAASLRGDLSAEQNERLCQLLSGSTQNLDLYLDLIFESSILLTWARGGESKGVPPSNFADFSACSAAYNEIEPPPSVSSNIFGVPEGFGNLEGLGSSAGFDHREDVAESTAGGFIANGNCPRTDSGYSHGDATPQRQKRGFSFNGMVDYLAIHEKVTGYIVASLIFVIASIVLRHVYINSNHEPNTAKHDTPVESKDLPPTAVQTPAVYVARISRQVDCHWASGAEAPALDLLLVGSSLSLESGLLELVYDTGARVILQGPCTYTVDSSTGGYLKVGKLTAWVEKTTQPTTPGASSLVAGGQWSVASGTPAGSSLAANHSPLATGLFTIRTPTAIVTDLGTEFGVEVCGLNETKSYVFQGKVRLVAVDGNGKSHGEEIYLEANQSAAVAQSGKGGTPHISVNSSVVSPHVFVRRIADATEQRRAISQTYHDMVLGMNPAVYFRMQKPPPGSDPLVVYDSAPGGHHGVFNFDKIGFKGPEYAPGPFGPVYLFRGPAVRDHAIVPDYPKATGNRLSVAAWALALSRSEYAIAVANVSGPGQFSFGFWKPAADIAVSISMRDGKAFCFLREGQEEFFPLGEWQHIAFVVDGSMLKLYRNGNLIGSAPCGDIRLNPTCRALGIACKTNDQGTAPDGVIAGFWHGRLAELAIFNHTLSAEEIKQLAGQKNVQEK